MTCFGKSGIDGPANWRTSRSIGLEFGMQNVVSGLGKIREIVAKHGRLSVDVASLDDDCDLYNAGLTSLATVGIMLALEDQFDIEFPESRLKRKTFESLESIAEAVADLVN